MHYDLQSHQQDRLSRILHCLHGYRYSKRLAMQNLQIPDLAETRILFKWLLPPRFFDKNRFTSSRQDAVTRRYWSHVLKNKNATD
jgi:SMC interacting uncharacterized protein involved in chromosome segregation